MPQRLSELFGIAQAKWDTSGAFDAFVGVDARLHIDPHLLAASVVPEFKNARASFDRHFEGVMTLLKHAESPNSPFFAQAVRQLTFREIPNTGLGYSKEGKRGSGIGPGLAAKVAELGKAIVDAGITDPDIFDLMGLLQDGIGADRISDMTAAIVIEPLFAYSDRIVKALGLPYRIITRNRTPYSIPMVPRSREPLLLVPRDVLRHLPVAESWYDIDTVSSHNAAIRRDVNRMIGRTWKQASRVPKWRLREAILKHPELIRDLLEQYRAKPAKAYDLAKDPDMLYTWQPVTRDAAASAPLALSLSAQSTFDDIAAIVRTLLTRFKELMEANRLYRLVYNDDGSPRREKAAQLALFGIADAYCSANNLDLSPETDSGTGPVDFKFSRGYKGRVLAEVKLTSNSKLIAGYDEQVLAYEKAEQAYHSFYVVLLIDSNIARLNRLIDHHNTIAKSLRPHPDLVVIDARPKPSASKR